MPAIRQHGQGAATVDPNLVALFLRKASTVAAGQELPVTAGPDEGGTAWAVESGRVLTNEHVVRGVPTGKLRVNGHRVTHVRTDPAADLAELTVPGLRVNGRVRLARARAGETVTIKAFPGRDASWVITRVNNTKYMVAEFKYPMVLVEDAPTDRDGLDVGGGSGAAIVNDRGEIVAMLVLGPRRWSRDIGPAALGIPTEVIERFLDHGPEARAGDHGGSGSPSPLPAPLMTRPEQLDPAAEVPPRSDNEHPDDEHRGPTGTDAGRSMLTVGLASSLALGLEAMHHTIDAHAAVTAVLGALTGPGYGGVAGMLEPQGSSSPLQADAFTVGALSPGLLRSLGSKLRALKRAARAWWADASWPRRITVVVAVIAVVVLLVVLSGHASGALAAAAVVPGPDDDPIDAAPPASLRTRDGGTTDTYDLDPEGTRLGRGSDNDIRVDAEKRSVSRRHAEFSYHPTRGWLIRSLTHNARTIITRTERRGDPTNPSDGVKLSEGDTAELSDGDRITVGMGEEAADYFFTTGGTEKRKPGGFPKPSPSEPDNNTEADATSGTGTSPPNSGAAREPGGQGHAQADFHAPGETHAGQPREHDRANPWRGPPPARVVAVPADDYGVPGTVLVLTGPHGGSAPRGPVRGWGKATMPMADAPGEQWHPSVIVSLGPDQIEAVFGTPADRARRVNLVRVVGVAGLAWKARASGAGEGVLFYIRDTPTFRIPRRPGASIPVRTVYTDLAVLAAIAVSPDRAGVAELGELLLDPDRIEEGGSPVSPEPAAALSKGLRVAEASELIDEEQALALALSLP
ncbi:MAG: FHA domain-containing protein, partial [Pseudonocardia sp.]|nr:FHA domain-containing protein [Pseudonocardia sp.]